MSESNNIDQFRNTGNEIHLKKIAMEQNLVAFRYTKKITVRTVTAFR